MFSGFVRGVAKSPVRSVKVDTFEGLPGRKDKLISMISLTINSHVCMLFSTNRKETTIMEQQVSIPLALYKRLESHAKGFDTPAIVLERLLDYYEKNSGETSSTQAVYTPEVSTVDLELVFLPNDEEEFKSQLLESRKAWICLHYLNGDKRVKTWNIKEFGPTSNLRGNLFSGYLRGWRNKGVYRAEVAIDIEAFS